jgi:hypothetical protein
MANDFRKLDDIRLTPMLTNFDSEWVMQAKKETFDRARLGTRLVFTNTEKSGRFPKCVIKPQFSTDKEYQEPDEHMGYLVKYKKDFDSKNKCVLQNVQPARALDAARTLCNGVPNVGNARVPEIDKRWHEAPDGTFEAISEATDEYIAQERAWYNSVEENDISREEVEKYVMDKIHVSNIVEVLLTGDYDEKHASWVAPAIDACDSPDEIANLK